MLEVAKIKNATSKLKIFYQILYIKVIFSFNIILICADYNTD